MIGVQTMKENYDYKKVWTRKIDKIEFYEGRVKIICYDDTEYIGKCIGECQGDEDGEDVDGICFELDNGTVIDFIESDIKSFEYLDGEPEE